MNCPICNTKLTVNTNATNVFGYRSICMASIGHTFYFYSNTMFELYAWHTNAKITISIKRDGNKCSYTILNWGGWTPLHIIELDEINSTIEKLAKLKAFY